MFATIQVASYEELSLGANMKRSDWLAGRLPWPDTGTMFEQEGTSSSGVKGDFKVDASIKGGDASAEDALQWSPNIATRKGLLLLFSLFCFKLIVITIHWSS